MEIIDKNGLKISKTLFEFINSEAIPGTGIDPEVFGTNFQNLFMNLLR